MATLVAIGGGIIGSFFGVPEIGFMVGSLVGSLLFKQPVGSPQLSDLKVTASTYGTPIHWGWGVVRVGGNIIWCSELQQQNEGNGNGKGSLGGPDVYQYTWTGALGLSQTDSTGPIVDILRIWADTKLVFDKTGASLGTQSMYGEPTQGKGGSGNGNTGSWYNNLGSFRIYYGTETQVPDAAMEALFGAENCNANRGQSFVVMDAINLINYGNRVPNFSFEVAYAESSAQSQLAQAIVWDVDDTVVGSVVNSMVVLDAGRQRAYFFSDASGEQGIKVVDLTTRTETVWCASDIFGVNPVGVVGTDGLLYVTPGDEDLNPLYQIDPDSITTSGFVCNQYGTGGSFIGGSGVPACASMAAANVNGGNYVAVFCSGTLTPKSCMLFQGLQPVQYSSGNFTDAVIASSGAIGVTFTNAVAYAFGTPNYGEGASSSPINIYEINAPLGLGVPPIVGDPFYSPGVFFEPAFNISPSQIDSHWTEFTGVVGPIVDQTDGNLIAFFSGSGSGATFDRYIAKINAGSGAIMWTNYTATPGQAGGGMQSLPSGEIQYQTQIVSGTMAWIDSEVGHLVFLAETQEGAMTKQTWTGLLIEGAQVWSDAVGSIIFYGDVADIMTDQWGVLVADVSEAQGVPVATIVTNICEGVGLTAADIDTTAIADLVCEGYVVDQQMSAADAIKALALAFVFDGVESDGLIKFIPRGGAPIATIPQSDLAYMDKKLNSLVNEVRAQEVDLPNQISINFIDPTRDFEASTQYFRRPSNPYPTMFSKNPRTENLPLVAQATFIKQLCEQLLYMQWVERVSYKTKLPWKYLKYDPTDVLTLTLSDSSTVQTRTLGINVGADFSMEVQSVAESSEVFQPNSQVGDTPQLPQYLILPNTATKMFLLDVPLLRDQDDTGQTYTILYYALSGYSSNWMGANVLQSPTGSNFQNVGQSITQAADWGVVTSPPGAPARPFGTDYVNTLTVVMTQGGANLASCSYLDMMNGQNGAVLYNSNTGAVEVIQFKTVTTNPDGSFTLSGGLLRGRRGTDTMTGAHVAGEYFIYLGSIITSAPGIGTIRMGLSNYNQQEFYEAVGIGLLQETGNPVIFPDTMRTLLPYAPVHVAAATDMDSNIDITWLRRTRINGNLHDNSGTVPLNELTEAYSVDIYDGDAIVRTLSVNYGADGSSPAYPPGVQYPVADVTEDFGSTPATLTLTVYQISGALNVRGFGQQVTVIVNGAPSP